MTLKKVDISSLWKLLSISFVEVSHINDSAKIWLQNQRNNKPFSSCMDLSFSFHCIFKSDSNQQWTAVTLNIGHHSYQSLNVLMAAGKISHRCIADIILFTSQPLPFYKFFTQFLLDHHSFLHLSLLLLCNVITDEA